MRAGSFTILTTTAISVEIREPTVPVLFTCCSRRVRTSENEVDPLDQACGGARVGERQNEHHPPKADPALRPIRGIPGVLGDVDRQPSVPPDPVLRGLRRRNKRRAPVAGLYPGGEG